MLINSMFWTIVAYFAWHALHARVEANWFAPVYPAIAIAAAVAVHLTRWDRYRQRLADFCLRWASPVGIVLFALLIVQANTGVLTFYRRDATVRSVGVGWRELADSIEAVRLRTGAACWLALDYGTTGWLAFYLPKGTCVVQPTSAHPLGQHARAICGRNCPASCCMSTRRSPGLRSWQVEIFALFPVSSGTQAHARPAGHRNLWA